jgi:hypothetical protein
MPGVCYSALRRLPRRDLHPLETNSVKQTVTSPLRHDAPCPHYSEAWLCSLDTGRTQH